MRFFKQERSIQVVSTERRGPDDPLKETAGAQEAAAQIATITDYNATAPAGWYPDPSDPTMVRYWDGAAWAERTQPAPSLLPAPVAEPVAAEPVAAEPVISETVAPEAVAPEPVATATDEATAPVEPEKTPAQALANEGEPARTENGDENPPTETDDADTWIGVTGRAVANAQAVGTAAAWENAAQAAAVVSEMAETMRVTAHAHQAADQLAQAATLAAQEARTARKAAAEAVQTAEQTAQAAKVAAQEAQAASLAAATARQRAEQTAQAAPKAVEMAEIAAKAAANAKSTVEQLDQVVAKASHANTPEAWSEARHIASVAWSSDAGQTPPPSGAQLHPVHETDAG